MNADFQQQQDQEEQEAEALQALIEIAAAGFTEQAERLAYQCGLGVMWKQHFQPRGNSNAQH
jgi:hypothetical protein